MDRVVCAADPCSYDVGGQPVFTDGLHFDAAGMRAVAPRVLPLLRQMAAATPAR
jgi:lysophospholipase L1-like esterase